MHIHGNDIFDQIEKFMGPTWGPPGSCRPQIGPILAPWILLSGYNVFIMKIHRRLGSCDSVCRNTASQYNIVWHVPLQQTPRTHQLSVSITYPINPLSSDIYDGNYEYLILQYILIIDISSHFQIDVLRCDEYYKIYTSHGDKSPLNLVIACSRQEMTWTNFYRALHRH